MKSIQYTWLQAGPIIYFPFYISITDETIRNTLLILVISDVCRYYNMKNRDKTNR